MLMRLVLDKPAAVVATPPASTPDPIELLRARTQGKSLRTTDSFDTRAFIYRVVELLASAASDDGDRCAAALLAIVENEEPPEFGSLVGVPARWGGTEISRRDDYLHRAVDELDLQSGESKRVALHKAWNGFAAGLYLRWRDDAAPPEDCSHLHWNLFFATKFNRGKVLSARQLGNIL